MNEKEIEKAVKNLRQIERFARKLALQLQQGELRDDFGSEVPE